MAIAPVPDARGVLIWRDTETNQAITVEVTVVAAERPHVFAFGWVSPDRQRATPTGTDAVLVEFRITADPGGTRLVVSESGLDAVDWDDATKAAYTDGHTKGWVTLLPQLRAYAEGLVTHGSE
jgi:uncharacterized protein YndB with AHSA1/START domain